MENSTCPLVVRPWPFRRDVCGAGAVVYSYGIRYWSTFETAVSWESSSCIHTAICRHGTPLEGAVLLIPAVTATSVILCSTSSVSHELYKLQQQTETAPQDATCETENTRFCTCQQQANHGWWHANYSLRLSHDNFFVPNEYFCSKPTAKSQ